MKKVITHKHHIVPKHMGGNDESSNLIELTIEDHALAHKALWHAHNKKEDYIAWKFLSGQAADPTAWAFKSSLGGKENIGSQFYYNANTGQEIHTKDVAPVGFIKGRNPNTFDKNRLKRISHDASGSKWCHNPNSPNETKMIKDISEIPTGWITGRSNDHITEVNKTKGFKWWHDPITGKETTALSAPGENWVEGLSARSISIKASRIVKFSDNAKGSKWYHNPLNTIETRMIKDGRLAPEGWIRGRGNNK